MLTYLDALCDALAARDADRLRHLLENPLARLLPPEAHAEVKRFLTARRLAPHAVPLAVLRFRDQTARLLSEAPRGVSEAAAVMAVEPTSVQRKRRTAVQTELPLSA